MKKKKSMSVLKSVRDVINIKLVLAIIVSVASVAECLVLCHKLVF